MTDYYTLGEPLPSGGSAVLGTTIAQATLRACASSRAFGKSMSCGGGNQETVGASDVLVLECVNDQVPSRNTIKINVRERLALVFPHDLTQPPQVRALRKSFPRTMHMNQVPLGEPASLCLYLEQWTTVRRVWTPQKFLQRILQWLADAAKGGLHRADQPVEALYFESTIEIILPPRFEERVADQNVGLLLDIVQRDSNHATARSRFVPREEAARAGLLQLVPVPVLLNLVVHGEIEEFPATLGALHDQLRDRGTSLLPALRDALGRIVGERGIASSNEQACVLILSIPIVRHVDGPIERTDLRGFHIFCDLASLGDRTGTLSPMVNGRHFRVPIVGGGSDSAAGDWRSIKAFPIAVKSAITTVFARTASGVHESGASERRMLAGAGALGGSLADLWAREGWGEWTLVDPDYVQPHNIVRHVAKDGHVGRYKVDVVKAIVEANYEPGYHSAVAVRDSILNTENPVLVEALKEATLLVDATTTLEVPRELARRSDVPRCASVFLTPSGGGCALLLEESKRSVRLDALEAQYYGALINDDDWGLHHLANPSGELRVGAGCRDLSFVISNELIQLHAAILARQLRLLTAQGAARARVWVLDDETGSVRVVDIPVRSMVRMECDVERRRRRGI